MIKNYLLLLALCIFSSTNAQTITIPDANFKAKLLEANETNYIANYLGGKSAKIDTNGNGEIEISEALKITELSLDNAKIISLEGIKNFVNLKYLSFYNNMVSTFDLNGMNIINLDCSSNQITDIDVTGLANLITLGCVNNQLTTLDLSKQNVDKFLNLNCSGNKLTILKIDQFKNLQGLSCSDNQLTNLNITAYSTLQSLDYSNNKMPNYDLKKFLNLEDIRCTNTETTNLDLTGSTKLRQIICDNNNLTNLDVSHLPILERIFCSNNKLTSLDLKNLEDKLEYLEVDNNKLSVIDLESFTKLVYVHASNNDIKTLNLSNASGLQELFVTQNSFLESLFIKNGSLEPLMIFSDNPNLKYICADDNQLDQIEDILQIFDSKDCTVNSYCTFSPGGNNFVIHGNVRNDSNNNGCDASDVPVSNLKFQISDNVKSINFISSEVGNYSIKVPVGSYTISPSFENPEYFSVSPTSLNVVFPTQPSPFSQDFCIRPNGVHNDLEVTLLPLEAARPGFDAKYKIVIKNKGNKTQWGTVRLNFNDAVLDFVSSVPKISNQITDNLSWNFTNLKPFETKEIDVVLNLNSTQETPSVNASDILSYIVDVSFPDTDEKVNDNIFSLNQTVVGSYDPNDKICLEGNLIKPELIGEFVHYMIRFENTGTYAAENIVIKDVIDLSKLDISTLVPTKASHSFITKISDGNKVEFIFEKINLPFNDVNNDGYIAFKIKTLPTLAVGDSFVNEANIYFDYNFPILTNKATSTFKVLETPDFAFSNYFNVYPNPVNEVLNIVNKSEIEIKSLSVYDILGQLVIAVPNAQKVVNIDVSKLQTGNYILKINSDKGIFNQKFVKK